MLNLIARKRNKPTADHPLLLAFGGKERAGKTTSAEHIIHKYGGQKFAFADALKAELFDLLAIRGLDLQEFQAYLKSKGEEIDFSAVPKPNLTNPKRADKIAWTNRNKESIGNIMQVYGDFKRSEDPNYFINKTLKDIEKAREAGEFVLSVDDVRFQNEAIALADIGFNLVRIQAGDETRKARGSCRDATHKSEVDLDSFPHNYVVFNDKEPHDLYKSIDEVVVEILNAE